MGRSGKVSQTTRHTIVRDIPRGRYRFAVNAQSHLANDLGIDITVNRMRQILQEEGLIRTRRRKKQKLHFSHRHQRMDFVRMYDGWTVDDRKKVLWTDEIRINRCGSDRRTWVWKNPRIKDQPGLYDERLTVPEKSDQMFLGVQFDLPLLAK